MVARAAARKKRRTQARSRSGEGKTIGDRIREARLAAGLTQAQLAGADMTKALISHIELGRTRPSQRSIQMIAQRLGKDVAYFLGRDFASRDRLLEMHERAAEAAFAAGDWTATGRHARAALRLSHGRRSVPALRKLAQAESGLGRPNQALALVRKALAMLEDGPEEAREMAWLLGIRANVYFNTGQVTAGIEPLERALHLLDEHDVQDPSLRARLHVALGTGYRRLGQTQQARSEYQQALANASRPDAIRLAGRANMGLAVAHYDSGELEAAIRFYQRAEELFGRASDAEWEVNAIRSIAEIQLELENVAEARRLAERVVIRGVETGLTNQLAGAKFILGEIALKEGRHEEALRLGSEAEKVLARAAEAIDVIQRADAIRLMADAHHMQKRWAMSDREYAKALALLERSSRPTWERVAASYAERLYERGLVRQAYQLLARARTPAAPVQAAKRPRRQG